ncbi:MAG: FecR domain-containing protein, partial [Gammaproteobacteria bacterium]
SIVRLNSRSELKVHLTPRLRRIDLLHGQALFEVAKDPSRPFVVYSEGVVVRAVGTQFDVYRKNEGTIVTVVEGRVALLGSGATPPSEAAVMHQPGANDTMVVAGEQVTVRSSGAVERRKKPNIAAATSWLQQELVFDGQALSAVVEEFNRYTRIPIVLDDPGLAQVRVNGVFHATDAEPLLSFVGRFKGVRIDRARSQIRITRDPSAAQGSAAPVLN